MTALFNTQILLDALSPTVVFVKHACTQVSCADESLAVKTSFLILDIDSNEPITNCECLLYRYAPTMEFLDTATTDDRGRVSFDVSYYVGEELYITPNNPFYAVPKEMPNSFTASESEDGGTLHFKDNWAFEVCRKATNNGFDLVLKPISKSSLDALGFYVRFYYVAYSNPQSGDIEDKYTYSMTNGKRFAAKRGPIYPEAGYNGRGIIRVPHDFYTEDDDKVIYIDGYRWYLGYGSTGGYAIAFFGHNIQSLVFAWGHGARQVFNFLIYPEQNGALVFQKALAAADGRTLLTTNGHELLESMSYTATYFRGFNGFDAVDDTIGDDVRTEIVRGGNPDLID